MINIKNLNFSYGEKNVFKDFSLCVDSGEKIGLSGPSGVGKTTLLRIIMGLENEYNGIVDTGNAVISAVFQEDRLLPFRTVLENLTLFASKERAMECLKALGLENAAELYPAELSGGMARRVAIARALSVDADIYIFDEAFSGLDYDNAVLAAEFINRVTKDKILIVVTHSKEDTRLLNVSRSIDIEKN